MDKLFNESITETSISFTPVKLDKNGGTLPAKEFALIDHVDAEIVLKRLNNEAKTTESASAGAVSLLVDILKSTAALDNYKGITEHQARVSKEFNSALRMVESAFLSSLPHFVKMPDAVKMVKLQETLSMMRKGSYSNARTHVSNMFCKLGKLPEAPNGKLFSVAAISKIVDNALYASRGEVDRSLSSQLAKCAKALREGGESFEIGHTSTAIAALKEMLATYEGLELKASERLTEQNTGVMKDLAQTAQAAIAKASEAPSMESLEAQYLNGSISEDAYKVLALEHHAIDLTLSETV